MKYLFYAFLCLTLLSACEENNTRSPEETCEEFMDKMADKEFEAAKKYTSRQTDPYLDLLTQGAGIFEMMNQKGNNFQAITTVEDEDKLTYNCTIDGEKATCQCTHKEQKEVSFSMNLIQENGQWLIHQPKETDAQ